ncbi:MAG: carbohydrate kinase [Verrucomicrobia bacterium]|nr:carbohydrate kinase [Verrucomicrobiota bacterium]
MPLPLALCFGEILWDFLPEGLFPGGAPFNVGYHLHQQGVPTQLVSAVGDDVLGEELLRRLTGWGLGSELIARRAQLRTGYVRATVGATGDAHYEIVADVAWDSIPATPEALGAAARAGALVFGSLAQRSPANRSALARLLAALPAQAWRIFDVNRRPPHDDFTLVRSLARGATVLKLNHEEAAWLAGEALVPGGEERWARQLASDFRCPYVVVTAGERGAGLWHEGRWHWESGRVVAVVDTVGSGDAFLASLVASLLEGTLSPPAALARACRLGEWVASCRGATPPYSSLPPCT